MLDGQDGCSFNGDNRAWDVSSVTYVGLRHLVERRYLEWDESSLPSDVYAMLSGVEYSRKSRRPGSNARSAASGPQIVG